MTLEGKKAPDFTLDGSDGRSHTIKEYAGKTVVIFFYPKDNTSGGLRFPRRLQPAYIKGCCAAGSQ